MKKTTPAVRNGIQAICVNERFNARSFLAENILWMALGYTAAPIPPSIRKLLHLTRPPPYGTPRFSGEYVRMNLPAEGTPLKEATDPISSMNTRISSD